MRNEVASPSVCPQIVTFAAERLGGCGTIKPIVAAGPRKPRCLAPRLPAEIFAAFIKVRPAAHRQSGALEPLVKLATEITARRIPGIDALHRRGKGTVDNDHRLFGHGAPPKVTEPSPIRDSTGIFD